MDSFYLISTELRNSFKPRLCAVRARLTNSARDDIAYVDVKPALPKKTYNTPGDINRLIVISREEKASVFSSFDNAIYVYICLPLKEEINTAATLSENDYRVLDWGSAYKSKDEAVAFTKVLTSYRHGMCCSEEKKHRRIMSALAGGIVLFSVVLGVVVFYVLSLLDTRFASLQKNIYNARQDVKHLVEEAIDSTQDTETTALVHELQEMNNQLEELGKEIEEVKNQLGEQPPEPVGPVEDAVVTPEPAVQAPESAPVEAAGPVVEEPVDALVLATPAPDEVVVEEVIAQAPQQVNDQPQTVASGTAPAGTENATIADAIAAVTRQVVQNQ